MHSRNSSFYPAESRQAIDILTSPDGVLVTGSSGFIGQRVVHRLLARGLTRITALTRATSAGLCDERKDVRAVRGNLLSPKDCLRATEGIEVIYHLAAGRGEKSYPDAFLKSVVTTRNLLDACLRHGTLKRIVNVSSFAVYSNRDRRRGRLLDETSEIEPRPEKRG